MDQAMTRIAQQSASGGTPVTQVIVQLTVQITIRGNANSNQMITQVPSR